MKQSEVKSGDTLHIYVDNEKHPHYGKTIAVKVQEVMNYNKPPFQYFFVEGSLKGIPAYDFEEFKQLDNMTTEEQMKQDPLPSCQAGRDGDCYWEHCPQLRDNEPATTRRHCPLDVHDEDYWGI